MEIQGRHDRSNEVSPLAYEPGLPASEPVHRTPRRKSLRSEARRRRIMANVFFVCSSVAALAVVGICYALLRQ
jgi:hypothetical protein